MDQSEAKQLLDAVVQEFRGSSFAALRELIDSPQVLRRRGPSQTEYQIELEAFWDNKPEGNLRVLASIDDGGLRALAPLSTDFILSPEGSFVGE